MPFSPLISHSVVDCAVHPGHEPAGHAHAGHSHVPQPGSWALLTGDSVHCFGDGVLIACAFMADLRLGVVAALADLIPQLQKRLSFSQTAAQIFWLAVGIGMVTVASGFAHGH